MNNALRRISSDPAPVERQFMFGVCHPGKKSNLMAEAGIEYLRMDVPYPFSETTEKTAEDFIRFLDTACSYYETGFKLFGVTPKPAKLKCKYDPGTDGYYKTYEHACSYMADRLGEVAPVWQVANEINSPPFRNGLSEYQIIELVMYGGSGVRQGNPRALVGINQAGCGSDSLRIYKRLYPNDKVDFDYAGIDAYPGSWEAGGPESWIGWIDNIYEITKKPIIAAEFGYSSKGGVLSTDEKRSDKEVDKMKKLMAERGYAWDNSYEIEEYNRVIKLILKMHYYKKWGYGWKNGHNPSSQAEYLIKAYEVFTGSPKVLGAMWYCWADAKKCFWCGQEDCPTETGWGLVDIDENPKPAYYAYKKFSERYRSSEKRDENGVRP